MKKVLYIPRFLHRRNLPISVLLFLFLVDWAALAQQWIQMRETMTGNVDQPPPPPPPPPPLPLSEGNLTIPTLPQSSLHPPTLTDSEVGKSTPGNEQSVNLGGKLGHDNNEVLSHSDNSNSHGKYCIIR